MTDMTTARAFPGRHFPGQGRSLTTFGYTPPLDRLIAVPFDTAGEFDAIVTLIKSGADGAVMRAGLYDCDSTGLPGSLIEDAGEHGLGTAEHGPMVIELSAPTTLSTPYWVVVLFGGTEAPSMLSSAAIPAAEMQRIFGITSSSLETGVFSVATANAVTAEYSYGTLPSTFPTPTLGGSTIWVSVRSTEA